MLNEFKGDHGSMPLILSMMGRFSTSRPLWMTLLGVLDRSQNFELISNHRSLPGDKTGSGLHHFGPDSKKALGLVGAGQPVGDEAVVGADGFVDVVVPGGAVGHEVLAAE
jgi:hypothetical protein